MTFRVGWWNYLWFCLLSLRLDYICEGRFSDWCLVFGISITWHFMTRLTLSAFQLPGLSITWPVPQLYLVNCCCFFAHKTITSHFSWQRSLPLRRKEWIWPVQIKRVLASIMLCKWGHLWMSYGCLSEHVHQVVPTPWLRMQGHASREGSNFSPVLHLNSH